MSDDLRTGIARVMFTHEFRKGNWDSETGDFHDYWLSAADAVLAFLKSRKESVKATEVDQTSEIG